MLNRFIGVLILVLFFSPIFSQPLILPQRDQARVIDDITEDRLKNILPALMRREGIDMWVLISRENNEDPVLKTLLPATWIAARRTTMLIIFDRGQEKGLEFLSVSRYEMGKLFRQAWNPETNLDQWTQLVKLIEERTPKKIGINKAINVGHADGLSANDYEKLLEVLPKKFYTHISPAEKLAVAWLETRSEKEMILYSQMCRIAHQIIAEGFSEKVIQPGVTTTEDVTWWYREQIKNLKLDTWFHPSVSIQRAENNEVLSKRPQPLVILPGDLLHVDFGITYLRLNTDTQQHAYVLKPGEKEIPEYLNNAFKRGNKLQDILISNIKVGKTGNIILAESRKQAIDQGITPSIYTHPIGYHGHGSGSNIGRWDQQNGIPIIGDYPIHYKTAYALELSATVFVIEWNKEIKIMLEEDGYFDENGFRFIDGRQMEIIQIPKKN